MNETIKFMKAAIKEALKAQKIGEIPVGSVIVKDGKIIARGYNKREKEQSVLGHAEIAALKKAQKKLGTWRLEDCDLYVTLEPCPMCAGAIIQSRIRNVYFGAYDLKTGASGSVLDLFKFRFNHEVKVSGGVLKEECSSLITNFFKELRKNKA